MNTIFESLQQFWGYTGFANMTWQHLVMILIGVGFITVAIKKDWEPLLLVPIGFGMVIGNIPFTEGLQVGIYGDASEIEEAAFAQVGGNRVREGVAGRDVSR